MQKSTPVIPNLAPLPLTVEGVENPVVCLDGAWYFRETDTLPTGRDDAMYIDWDTVNVPGTVHPKASYSPGMPFRYVYKKLVTIPQDWRGHAIVLQFEGLNGTADIYCDNAHLGRHKNGFITFQYTLPETVCDHFLLTVAVDESLDRVSTFNHGGILHSVYMMALPKPHLSMLRATTAFDEQYRDAVLEVQYALSGTSDVPVRFTLIAPDGSSVISAEAPAYETVCRIAISTPLPWDAEHPNLYALQAELGTVYHTEIRFGFRQIERRGNQLFVNGQEVKLRGVCRHEVTALNGRCLTREMIQKDVALFKEANCNYIRTSHYPPSTFFLDLCDQEGLYVEDELALAFIARTLDYTQQDPEYTERYLSHFAEVYARDCNHPCVLIWSLCNESFGGTNFDQLNRFAKQTDLTRPTKFSYPMTMPQEHLPVDIWSIHYGNLESNLADKKDNVSVGGAFGKDRPVIHDEYVHVPCYNRTEHRRDPSVRSFWGESIKRFWDKIWNTQGALGGAVWAGIDETDVFIGGKTCLEWGVIDIWRRKKPEFYMMRKAYSPIRMLEYQWLDDTVSITVENRFCHTNLAETKVFSTQKGKRTETVPPACAPKETVSLVLPVASTHQALTIAWLDSNGTQIDEFVLQPDAVEAAPPLPPGALQCTAGAAALTLQGERFSIVFDKAKGQITQAKVQGKIVLIGGPVMHMPYMHLPAWQCDDFAWQCDGPTAQVTLRGRYGSALGVTFQLEIAGNGTLRITYHLDSLDALPPQPIKLRVGTDDGGLDEYGIGLLCPPGAQALSWRHKGLWNSYPEDHIARLQGTAQRFSQGSVFSTEPTILWKDEMKNYILNGRYDVDYKGTADFRALRSGVLSASLRLENGSGVTLRSDGRHSVRAEIAEPSAFLKAPDDPLVTYEGTWYTVPCTNATFGAERSAHEAGAALHCDFTGTGIVWYGPVDTVYGYADVYIDGKKHATIDQRVDGVDFPGSCAGFDKKYGYPVFSVSDLPMGPHRLTIRVLGKHAADAADSYIAIDSFRFLNGTHPEPAWLWMMTDFNYPCIAWGNYHKPPIFPKAGDTDSFTVELLPR